MIKFPEEACLAKDLNNHVYFYIIQKYKLKKNIYHHEDDKDEDEDDESWWWWWSCDESLIQSWKLSCEESYLEMIFIKVKQRWANSVLKTEYKYEYYSAFRKWPNTNTNNIRSSKNDRIRIIFGLPKMTEYE